MIVNVRLTKSKTFIFWPFSGKYANHWYRTYKYLGKWEGTSVGFQNSNRYVMFAYSGPAMHRIDPMPQALLVLEERDGRRP